MFLFGPGGGQIRLRKNTLSPRTTTSIVFANVAFFIIWKQGIFFYLINKNDTWPLIAVISLMFSYSCQLLFCIFFFRLSSCRSKNDSHTRGRSAIFDTNHANLRDVFTVSAFQSWVSLASSRLPSTQPEQTERAGERRALMI